MPLRSRILQLAKDPERPEECQDAYGLDPARSIAAVADGVSSAIFSRQWAAILARATIADPPDHDDEEAFADWLAQRRQTWTERIDVTGLAWFQKAKLPTGAFSTLLWVHVAPREQPEPGQFGAHRLHCRAIGDSCLFHFRGGEFIRSFPVQESSEFEADPIVLGSVDLRRDRLMQFVALDEVCYEDDLLVLCTDAIAEWAMRRVESGSPPDWDAYWEMSEPQWQEEIADLRQQREMRHDDATLLLLRVVPEGTPIGQPEQSPLTAKAEEVVGIWNKWKNRAVSKYREKFRRNHP